MHNYYYYSHSVQLELLHFRFVCAMFAHLVAEQGMASAQRKTKVIIERKRAENHETGDDQETDDRSCLASRFVTSTAKTIFTLRDSNNTNRVQ